VELPRQSEPEPKPNGGLLSGLGNLFQTPEPELQPSPIFSTASQPAPGGSFRSEAGPLSPEAEQILSQIPDAIGGEAGDPGGPADLAGADGLELGGEICDEAAARATLEWIGDMLADWRKREDYRQAGKNAAGAAKHWAKVVNQAWARFAPQLLTSLGNAWPGLIPAVAMTAVAFGPAIASDVKQSAKERAGLGLVQPQSGPVPVPQPPAPRTGLVRE